MTITPSIIAVSLYTGLLGLVAIWLGFVVGKYRGSEGISIGDGGNEKLIRAMRGQANFVENVPLILIMMLCMALFGTPAWVIHILGIAMLISRILHGLHFSKPDQPSWQRAAGAIVSILVMLVVSIGLIGHAVYAMM